MLVQICILISYCEVCAWAYHFFVIHRLLKDNVHWLKLILFHEMTKIEGIGIVIHYYTNNRWLTIET